VAEFACVLTAAQTVKCFGQSVNDSAANPPASLGILGAPYYNANDPQSRVYYNGAMGDALPTVVLGSGTVTVSSIAAGGTHTCVLLTGGTVRCWGYGPVGQLGNKVTGTASKIGDVSSDMTGLKDILTGVSSIAAGKIHTCAAMYTNQVRCWGSSQPALGIANGSNADPSLASAIAYDGSQ
jgi:hypothetical protein